MTVDKSLPFQRMTPSRSPAATTRLAWSVLAMAGLAFLLLCGLLSYGFWNFVAYAMVPQQGNVLEAYHSPVSLIHAGEVLPIAVPLRKPLPLLEGETVRVADTAPPGAVALVTLWDGSTLQLFSGAEVRFERLRATRYSDRRQEVRLELLRGEVMLGIARLQQYQQVDLALQLDGATMYPEPGGTYWLRQGDSIEIAVRKGRARVSPAVEGDSLLIGAGQKAMWREGGFVVEAAVWELLQNGDFEQGLSGWSFRAVQASPQGAADARQRLEQYQIEGELCWAVGLERKGDTQHVGQGILSQVVEQDLSPYRSVRLEFDLRLNYQSALSGEDPLAMDYPFIVRLNYQDEQGKDRQYIQAFYYRPQNDGEPELPSGVVGEVVEFPHYHWKHVSIELLGIEPRPILLNSVDLLASGLEYLSWVSNVSLLAE